MCDRREASPRPVREVQTQVTETSLCVRRGNSDGLFRALRKIDRLDSVTCERSVPQRLFCVLLSGQESSPDIAVLSGRKASLRGPGNSSAQGEGPLCAVQAIGGTGPRALKKRVQVPEPVFSGYRSLWQPGSGKSAALV